MDKITENTIEEFTIELLERLGYQCIYPPDIAPDTSTSSVSGIERRNSCEDVLLTERLQNAIRRINPTIPVANQFTVHNTSPSGDGGTKFLNSFSTAEDFPVVQVEKKREYTTKPNIREKKSCIIDLINIHEVPYV